MKLIYCLLISTLSFAQTSHNLRINYDGFEGGRRVFVRCDYAEDATRYFLSKVGALNIKTSCFGGIDFGPARPVRLNISYTLEKMNESRKVDIQSRYGNCFFETYMIRSIVRKNSRLSIISDRDHCFRGNSNYSYKLLVKWSFCFKLSIALK